MILESKARSKVSKKDNVVDIFTDDNINIFFGDVSSDFRDEVKDVVAYTVEATLATLLHGIYVRGPAPKKPKKGEDKLGPVLDRKFWTIHEMILQAQAHFNERVVDERPKTSETKSVESTRVSKTKK